VLGLVLAGCGARPAPGRPADDRIAIIAAERGPQGARLVSIDEHGDRQFELVQPAGAMVRDTHPAVSPDGKWIVFASSRDRALDQTSLWIAPAGVAMPPRRLTDGPAIDAHPVWMPDGAGVVFASTRGGGDYDLWRLALRAGAPGELAQLTDGPGHEVTPAIAPDGTIVYAEVTPDEQRRQIETHLEERAPDGAIRRLTAGPADSSPALSTDGRRLVFARPRLHGGKPDSELWLMARGDEAAAPLVYLPVTDESGPVWSRDGRFVFATSVLRGDQDRVVFSAIVHVDMREAPPVARILEDRVGAIPRLTPAVAAIALDAAALRGNPEYLPQLARIMTRLIERQRTENLRPPEPATPSPSGPSGTATPPPPEAR
jgi:dipeptidyl aminopeptidase/acylaminoacyl peptidase